MNGILLSLILLAGSAAQPSIAADLPYCPAPTSIPDDVALGLATSSSYADVRSERHLQAVAPSAVRVLADPGDASACERMQQYAVQKAAEAGGSLAGTTVVFYQAGPYYYAVLTIPPPPPARPGAVHLRLRFVPVYVFDSSFNPVASLAL